MAHHEAGAHWTHRRRLAVHLTADAARQVRGGSPWVFDGSIERIGDSDEHANTGDLAVLFDPKRKFVGVGLYDPTSPIAVRVLISRKQATIDETFFDGVVENALEVRHDLTLDRQTNAFRCINGENDHMPGLVADLYDTTLVIKLYTAAWEPYLETVVAALEARLPVDTVLVRASRNVSDLVPELEGLVVRGTLPEGTLEFTENGVVMSADVVSGHKTGHFIDQRENRFRVRALHRGSTMLDVFSCSGGFALNAAIAGATEVTLIDRSEPALALAESNFARNRELVGDVAVTSIKGDAATKMDVLIEANARFATVVVDPPSLTPNKSSITHALETYEELAMRAFRLAEPGGLVMCASCSARVSEPEFLDAVTQGAKRAGRRIDLMESRGHAVDHPATFELGAYLKALFLRAH